MRELVRAIFSRWVMLGALLIGILMTVVALLLLWYSKPAEPPKGKTTAVLKVVRMPASTPTPPATAVSPTETASGEQGEGLSLTVGSRVQVQGTAGEGLRVRENPGLSQVVLFVANEGEEFEIRAGPRDLDGYTWWLLVSPTDARRTGWAVSRFLVAIQP